MSGRWAVIGSNSFSGAHFVSLLLVGGADVLGISRSPEPDPVFLPYRWQPAPGRFTFTQLDLNRDVAHVAERIGDFRPDYVVNFAAQGMVAQSWDAPTDWFQTNVVAQVALHDRLRKMNGIKRYVHVGTPEVYGTCDGAISEDHRFNPSTPYAVSRAACDLSLRTFVDRYRFPVVTTRAANVYGPGQQLYRIIPRAMLSIRLGQRIPLHGGGTSIRSFIHIKDVAHGTQLAAERGEVGGCFHLATPDLISIRALVERVCTRMDVRFADAVSVEPERPGKDHAYVLSTARAEDRLGWRASIALDHGLGETLAWIDANLDRLRTLPLDYVHKA